MQFGIEQLRSHAPQCAGTVVWQLNDCWPVTSWAAVDGDGRRKPLFYALKHAYADRLLTVQPRPAGLSVVAVNNTDSPWAAEGVARRVGPDGVRLAEQRLAVRVAPRNTWTVVLDAAVAQPGVAGRELISVRADQLSGWHFFADHIASELSETAFETTAEAVPGDTGYTSPPQA